MHLVARAILLSILLVSVTCQTDDAEDMEHHEDDGGEPGSEIEDHAEAGEDHEDSGADGVDPENLNGEAEGIPYSADQVRKLHSTADHNNDGKMSMEEAKAHAVNVRKANALKEMEVMMEELDKDKDGKMSLAEHLAAFEDPTAEEGDSANIGEDAGLLETRKTETAKFKAVDADRDGQLDVKEATSLFHHEEHEGVHAIILAESLAHVDTDKDGKVSEKEFLVAAYGEAPGGVHPFGTQEEFKSFDSDGDGFLNAKELWRWENGLQQADEDLKTIFKDVDQDGDKHITADELAEGVANSESSSVLHAVLQDFIDRDEL